jgi:hypothetical protein
MLKRMTTINKKTAKRGEATAMHRPRAKKEKLNVIIIEILLAS